MGRNPTLGPPMCRHCQEPLLPEVNWYASYAKHNNRVCRTCVDLKRKSNAKYENARRKDWRDRNRDKVNEARREYFVKYYAENREKILVSKRLKYQNKKSSKEIHERLPQSNGTS
jgi:hypothetical protein